MSVYSLCSLYHITLLTFLLALGHFLSELFVFGTAAPTIGVLAPLMVASKYPATLGLPQQLPQHQGWCRDRCTVRRPRVHAPTHLSLCSRFLNPGYAGRAPVPGSRAGIQTEEEELSPRGHLLDGTASPLCCLSLHALLFHFFFWAPSSAPLFTFGLLSC